MMDLFAEMTFGEFTVFMGKLTLFSVWFVIMLGVALRVIKGAFVDEDKENHEEHTPFG